MKGTYSPSFRSPTVATLDSTNFPDQNVPVMRSSDVTSNVVMVTRLIASYCFICHNTILSNAISVVLMSPTIPGNIRTIGIIMGIKGESCDPLIHSLEIAPGLLLK